MKFFIIIAFIFNTSFANEHLFDCYKKGSHLGKYASILCNGVKTLKEKNAVIKCYKDGPDDAKFATVLCSGVKTSEEASDLIKCYYNSPTVKGKFAAILCSKNGIGSNLVL
ncbi:hypothetical protein N9N67_00220 [Bacteriovoracaceae bacterium]|nr:hypothetical protein [Bacteriovoracaceae bacterium]